MPTTKANGIEIAYETFGDEDDPALLLVMGFATQMVLWYEGFCEALAGAGFHVIRYDNRDTGLSSRIERGGIDFGAELGKALQGQPVDAPYTLVDMAEDGFGLLDALGVDAAHVVGQSMGGMIGQTMAIHAPERVLSLTSIYSTPSVAAGPPTPEGLQSLLTPPPRDREGFVEHMVANSRLINGPVMPFDEDRVRPLHAMQLDRGWSPEGAGNQLLAVHASGDRTEALAGVRVPTLVVHGTEDPLITLPGGEATAAAIPGAELLVIEGMGHDLPEAVWPQVVAAIRANADRA